MHRFRLLVLGQIEDSHCNNQAEVKYDVATQIYASTLSEVYNNIKFS